MTLLGAIGVSVLMVSTGTAGAPTAPGNGPPPSIADGPAPTKPAATAKLAPAIAKEMQDAIVAVNKSLGLESWPAHGVKPCIDRGGQGILAKDVTPEDARRCASTATEKGFPELGKAYVVAILMGEIGPVTVMALGAGEQAAGWGAYSCDPTRACKPMKINPGNKWGKRLDERRAKACAETQTIWLPAGHMACPGR